MKVRVFGLLVLVVRLVSGRPVLAQNTDWQRAVSWDGKESAGTVKCQARSRYLSAVMRFLSWQECRWEPQRDGVLVRANMDGATNWMAPSFDPQTGLFYVNAQTAWGLWYLVLNKDNKPDGHQGGTLNDFWSYSQLKALDYETGKTVLKRELGPGHSFTGVLTTAGHLLFSGDTSGNIFALDPADGNTLWHVYAGGTLNSSPMTYLIEGQQYVITAIDSVVYAWTLPSGH